MDNWLDMLMKNVPMVLVDQVSVFLFDNVLVVLMDDFLLSLINFGSHLMSLYSATFLST